jgi:hypothetical protein
MLFCSAKLKNKLSPIEKQELLFYIQEYNTINKNELLPNNQVQFIKKDRAGRWRSMFAENANASIYLEPVFSGALVEGPRISYREQSSGFHFFGTAGNLLLGESRESGKSGHSSSTFLRFGFYFYSGFCFFLEKA